MSKAKQDISVEVDGVEDVSPELDAESFDLDAWISGVTSTVRAVTLYQRPDLLAEIDRLKRDLRIAEQIPDADRGMNDRSPDSIRREIEQVAQEFEASSLVFKVEGRSDEARDRIEKRLKKQGVTDKETVILHQLEDAIVEPKGITVTFLRRLQEKSETQLRMLMVASGMASYEPPKVDVDFLSKSSADRKQRGRS